MPYSKQSDAVETWELWYPKAGAAGLYFARGRIAAGAEIMLVHAAPESLTVSIFDEQGQRLAHGRDLAQTDDTPITRLTRRGDSIERVDIWPDQPDLNCLVILPGGEVGTLRQWWHADDYSEWRWQIELYNRRS